MFRLFKQKPVPSGPITFDFDMLIEREVSDVFPLIDWADERNAKRQLGHCVEGSGTQFSLRFNSMPEHRFDFDVTKSVQNEVYAFTVTVDPPVGKLAHSSETYTFEPAEGAKCLLRVVNEVQFVDGLSMKQLEREMMVMSVATNDALLKLKVLAERGLESAKAVENISFC